jgi:hypothetical protein
MTKVKPQKEEDNMLGLIAFLLFLMLLAMVSRTAFNVMIRLIGGCLAVILAYFSIILVLHSVGELEKLAPPPNVLVDCNSIADRDKRTACQAQQQNNPDACSTIWNKDDREICRGQAGQRDPWGRRSQWRD